MFTRSVSQLVEPGRSEDQVLAEISERLQRRFPDTAPQDIEREVTRAHHEFDGKPIRDFVPILVEREALDRLRASRMDQPSALV